MPVSDTSNDVTNAGQFVSLLKNYFCVKLISDVLAGNQRLPWTVDRVFSNLPEQ